MYKFQGNTSWEQMTIELVINEKWTSRAKMIPPPSICYRKGYSQALLKFSMQMKFVSLFIHFLIHSTLVDLNRTWIAVRVWNKSGDAEMMFK